ncbi:MAG: hypothetical protein M3527_09980 [Actinomycetota bacterium]|nr:hypothetical protein [Acidimicrobiia bacterium]MDQ3294758.1 hypothetical protein [Actinomycetota bacterium]
MVTAPASPGLHIDPRAIAFGAAVVLVVAVPVALIGALVLDEGSNGVFAFAVPIVAAYVLGGYVAGSKRPDTPLAHGAIAAFTGFAIAQAISVVVQLVQDESVSPVALIFNGLLAANIGLVGGWLSGRRAASPR